MKRIILLIAVALLAVTAVSCQQRYESPITVEWDAPADGFADYYEVAVQPVVGTDTFQVDAPAITSQYIDLEALDLYGVFVVMIRSVALTEPDLVDYSDWATSITEADVITVDGVAATFTVYRSRKAGTPLMIRVQ